MIGGKLTDGGLVYVARGVHDGSEVCGFYDPRKAYAEAEILGAKQFSPFDVLVLKDVGKNCLTTLESDVSNTYQSKSDHSLATTCY